jgi:hypothetical protein
MFDVYAIEIPAVPGSECSNGNNRKINNKTEYLINNQTEN